METETEMMKKRRRKRGIARDGERITVPMVLMDAQQQDAVMVLDAERAEAKAAYNESDAIYQFTFDASGTLAPNATPVLWYEWMARGPRHMCFHPTLPMACECSSSRACPFLCCVQKGCRCAQTPQTRCLRPSRPSR